MKVTLIQMDSTETRKGNEQKALKYMRQAVLAKTDIICLSESFVYWGKEYEQRCCTLKDIEKYRNFAEENDVNIILGSINLLDEKSNKTTNTCFVINREGNIVHRYDKKYMYQVKKENLMIDETQRTIAGKTNGLFELDGVKMGVGICFDLRYPEYFRQLIKEGAEVIFLPSHFRKATGEMAWNVLTRARAIENQVYFCACNQTGEGNCGNTQVISYDGKIMSNIETEEGIITQELNLEEQRKYRRELPVLEQMK